MCLYLKRGQLIVVIKVTVLCIRAVQAQMFIGIRESQVRVMIDEALAAAGLTERWALVLFGGKPFFPNLTSELYVPVGADLLISPTVENAALPHGSGSDRELGKSDFILIDAGGLLYEYNSDVTRVRIHSPAVKTIQLAEVLYRHLCCMRAPFHWNTLGSGMMYIPPRPWRT